MNTQVIQPVFEMDARKLIGTHIETIVGLNHVEQRRAVMGLTFDFEFAKGMRLALVMLDMLEKYKHLRALGVAHTWALERM